MGKRKSEVIEEEVEVEVPLTEKKKKKKQKAEEEEVDVEMAPVTTEKKKKKKAAEAEAEEEPAPVTTEKKKKKKKAEAEEEAEEEVPVVTTEKKKKKKKAEEEEAEEEAPTEKKKKKKEEAEEGGDETGTAEEGPATAFMKGLPFKVDEAQLKKDFAECGEVIEVKLLMNDEGWSRGVAFVTFKTKAGRDKAIEYNDTEYQGRTITVNEAENAKSAGKGKGKGKGPQEKPPNCKSVILKNLKASVEEDDLWTVFESCTSLSRVKILTDQYTGVSRGLAFLDFDEEADVDKAMAMDPKEAHGAAFYMDYNAPKDKGDGKGKKGGGKGGPPGEKPEGCKSIIVKNLKDSVDEDALWEFFSECTSLSRVKVLTDRDTGAPKGMAFIDFDDDADVDTAIKLHSKEVHGQPVYLDFSRPKGDDKGKGKGDGKGKGKGKDGKGKGKGKPDSAAKAKSSGSIQEFAGSKQTFDDDSD